MRSVPSALAARLVAGTDSLSATFDDIRMEDIAEASGIPRATLYYYFAGKDDILSFLLNATLTEFKASLMAVAKRPGPARGRLTELAETHLVQMAAHPATAQLLVSNIGRTGKLPDISSSINDVFITPIQRILKDGVRAGDLPRRDVGLPAMSIFATLTVAGLQQLVMEGTIDAAELATATVDFLWEGLARTPPA